MDQKKYEKPAVASSEKKGKAITASFSPPKENEIKRDRRKKNK